MQTTARICGIILLIGALAVLAITQWLPALAFLPVGVLLLLWDGRRFSPDQPGRRTPDGTRAEDFD